MKSLTDLICWSMDRLLELGGGTDDGVAEVLEDAGVTGSPSCAQSCVVAEWIARDLYRWRVVGVEWADLEVLPNRIDYELGHVSWDELDEVGRSSWHVTLPPVLSDVAEDFDADRLPELDDSLYVENYEAYRDDILDRYRAPAAA